VKPATGRPRAAGVAYTLIVFAVAFVIGAIRVTLLAPRVGALLAVLVEAPIVLAVGWRASTWCVRRFRVPPDPDARAWMGAVAFAALMALELGVAVLAFGETLPHYMAKFATAPGLIGLAVQGGFALIPWLQWRVGTSKRRPSARPRP
jgi:hypothetical protein